MHNLLYSKLKSIPEEHPIFLIENSNITRKSQEKMVEVIFEYFNFPKCIFWNQQACSLISTGASEGLVFECGAGTSVCSPIHQGLIIKDATYHSLISGN